MLPELMYIDRPPCTTGVRPHLWASGSLSLAETVTVSGRLGGVSSGRMYLGKATTTTPLSPVLIQERTLCRQRKGDEGPGGRPRRPEASRSAVRGSLRVLRKHAPSMSPAPRPAGWPPLKTKPLFKAVPLSAAVWCPENRGARRYIRVPRLPGKRPGGEMSAFGYQWKWKNRNNKLKKKKDQEGQKIYFGDNGTGVR